jgi:hypothetical protein
MGSARVIKGEAESESRRETLSRFEGQLAASDSEWPETSPASRRVTATALPPRLAPVPQALPPAHRVPLGPTAARAVRGVTVHVTFQFIYCYCFLLMDLSL